MTKIIEIIVAPDGSSRVETKGFVGNACREASLFLQEALGKTINETLTAEFYENDIHQHHHQKEET